MDYKWKLIKPARGRSRVTNEKDREAGLGGLGGSEAIRERKMDDWNREFFYWKFNYKLLGIELGLSQFRFALFCSIEALWA